MPIIDIHPHIIADDATRYPLDPLGGKQSGWSQSRPVTTEQMIAAMDKTGVDKAAIVQASTCYGHDNSYVADAVAVRILKGARIDLVDHAGLPPQRGHANMALGIWVMRQARSASPLATM